MTDWINQRFGTNFTENDLLNVKNFSLIWNVFESTACANHFSINRIEQEIGNRNIDVNNFTDNIAYFKNRYVTNGALNGRFAHLNFRPNDRQALVEDVLLEINTSPNDIILAIVIIVYRYRNNLFHGVKNIQQIDGQNENFQNANTFLTRLIDNF